MLRNNTLDFSEIDTGINILKTPLILSINEICEKLKNNNFRLSKNCIPSKGGVYIFWWTGDKNYFKKKINRELILKGPSKRKVNAEISNNWLEQFENHICLYVGKTHSNLKWRISNHLRLNSKRDYANSNQIFNEKLKSTLGQLKRGLEELFLNESDIRDLLLKNVGISYYSLDGDIHSVTRFYLEDKAIGEFYPIINLDIER